MLKRKIKKYLYRLIDLYKSHYIVRPCATLEINPYGYSNDSLPKSCEYIFTDKNGATIIDTKLESLGIKQGELDYIFLTSGLLHFEKDVQKIFKEVESISSHQTRIIILFYNSLWRPFGALAAMLKLRPNNTKDNWLEKYDISNMLSLENLEVIKSEQKILLPLYVPLLSKIANKYIAPLPLINKLCLANFVVAKSAQKSEFQYAKPSVSIVVPARNEEGNVKTIVSDMPLLGPNDEIIFVEGNSSDNTWEKICEVQYNNCYQGTIKILRQPGKGKGDAVRAGFAVAKNEILMIYDADRTVPPNDLYKFYEAITSGRAEFINGSRLVYPMEKGAMRFFNLLGNKFFALAFSYILGQRIRDTLCGTKVLSKENYNRIALGRSYFGDFDPFGDFDLILGSTKLCLSMAEVPIVYRERTYGDTNISRWSHGLILLKMFAFASKKIKFI